MNMRLILTSISLGVVACVVTSCSTSAYPQQTTTGTTTPPSSGYGVPQTQTTAMTQSSGVTPNPYPSVNSAQTTPAPAPATTTAATSKVYTIVKGDTLFGIARKHNTTYQAIQKANGMTGTIIYPGKTLRIP